MQPAKLNHFRDRLLDLRSRVGGELSHLIESVPDKAGFPGNLSNVPMHLADTNAEGLDGELMMIHNEEQILLQVDAALNRLDEGVYGRCQQCGGTIAEARLEALPYTAVCIQCAHKAEQVGE